MLELRKSTTFLAGDGREFKHGDVAQGQGPLLPGQRLILQKKQTVETKQNLELHKSRKTIQGWFFAVSDKNTGK